MPKNRSNEPYRVYVLWGLNLAITPIWPDSSSIVLMPKKIGYENSLVVQNGYTHIQFYFLCTSCADLCLICLLQVWCFFFVLCLTKMFGVFFGWQFFSWCSLTVAVLIRRRGRLSSSSLAGHQVCQPSLTILLS